MRAKWILIGVAVLALGASLWWLNGTRTYDDLAFGALSAYPEGGRVVQDAGDGEVIVVPLRSGGEVRYVVSVRNEGERTVKITGVGKNDPDTARRDYQMTPVRVRMSPDAGLDYDRLVAFSPVRLGPGEEQTYVIYERMPSCRHFSPGGGTGISAFDVRFESFVFDRETTIPLREPIQVIKGRDCT